MTKKPASKKKPKKKEEPVEAATKAEHDTEDHMIEQVIVEQVKPKKKRSEPRMTHKAVWLLYAEVLRAKKGDDVFDLLARTFEGRSDLGYWLYRINMGPKLIKLGKGRDFVQYFRAVAHSLFQDTRHEAGEQQCSAGKASR